MANDFILKRGTLDGSGNFVPTGGLSFKFTATDAMTDRHSAPNTTINAPGQGSEETTTFNLGGLQRFVGFDFKLQNTGEDKSLGTNASEVITIDEQYDYLKNTFLSGDTDIQYQMSIGTLVVINCMIDDLSINPTFSNPTFYKGSIQISEGKNALSINA